MKNLLGSLKARVAVGMLAATASIAGVASGGYANWCNVYSHSMATYDPAYGGYCIGVSIYDCTMCYDEGAGTSCSTHGQYCRPRPLHQN